MAAWNILTDTFKDLFNKFGQSSQDSIDGWNGIGNGNKSAARMYGLLNINDTGTPTGPASLQRMSDFNNVDNVAWNSGPTFTGGNRQIELTGTLDGNNSRAAYRVQVLSTLIGTAPTGVWDGTALPAEEGSGDFFKDTGWKYAANQAANSVTETVTGLVGGHDYYCRVMYFNGFNSLDENEWDFSTTVTRSTTAVTLTVPSIVSFSPQTDSTFDATWSRGGNDLDEFDSYRLEITNITDPLNPSDSYTYDNASTGVTGEQLSFFPNLNDTIRMELRVIDDVNTDSPDATLDEPAG